MNARPLPTNVLFFVSPLTIDTIELDCSTESAMYPQYLCVCVCVCMSAYYSFGVILIIDATLAPSGSQRGGSQMRGVCARSQPHAHSPAVVAEQ
jgi:hypothetical protein